MFLIPWHPQSSQWAGECVGVCVCVIFMTLLCNLLYIYSEAQILPWSLITLKPGFLFIRIGQQILITLFIYMKDHSVSHFKLMISNLHFYLPPLQIVLGITMYLITLNVLGMLLLLATIVHWTCAESWLFFTLYSLSTCWVLAVLLALFLDLGTVKMNNIKWIF